ncbi:hypothetical protein TRAPUB_10174 [Trametes pubescens]|uniref:Heterokaryon incompatibility domain-containing protein n=1 Tax=Trametes pubescens TaxID=154538 RepID=A0A1M2W097_TRAPU|nr:hypothetical protein TRAPUB_10174 [Trametes pubescens]
MDGEKLLYRITPADMEAGKGVGCTLCALLQDCVDGIVPKSSESAELDFVLKVRRERKESEASGPSPKTAPRLRIRPVDRPSLVTEYYLYTAPSDPAARDIITRPPLSRIDSTEAYQHTLARLDECIASHNNCPKPRETPLPTRVIDCMDPSKPRLLMTAGTLAPYLALSYVWGSNASHVTLESNIDKYLVGIDTSVIPRTIQDAITVTHKLGMRYLWVDAFCIIQNSTEDKNHELARMGQIYHDAYLTIVAASSAHGNAGILQDRPIPTHYATHPHLPYHCRDGRVGSISVFTDGIPDGRIQREPVDFRAWCFQERLLSPRKLIYATDALEYHCQTDFVSVNNSLKWGGYVKLNKLVFGLSDDEIRSRVAQWIDEDWGELQMEWVLTVSNYSSRALTQKTDKLVAFAGVAEQFNRLWHASAGRYVAGLWEKHLSRDLLWLRESSYQDWLDDPLHPRPQVYLAPSWSWASVEGRVRVQPPVLYSGDDVEVCDVLKCDVTLMDERQPYGRVTAGRLEIRAARVPIPSILWDDTSEQHYELVVPTEELRARITTALPQDGIVVGKFRARGTGEDSTSSQITVRREHMQSELLAVVDSTEFEDSLLTSVGRAFIAFDGPESGAPGRAWFVSIYQLNNENIIYTEGLIVPNAGYANNIDVENYADSKHVQIAA